MSLKYDGVHKQELGEWGEEQAVKYLEKKGYKIVDRNNRIKKVEIDIIAWHNKPHFGHTLCFVEVKTRSKQDGSAERSVDRGKLKNIFTAARMYCLGHNINVDSIPIQFEQVSVYLGKEIERTYFFHYTIPVD